MSVIKKATILFSRQSIGTDSARRDLLHGARDGACSDRAKKKVKKKNGYIFCASTCTCARERVKERAGACTIRDIQILRMQLSSRAEPCLIYDDTCLVKLHRYGATTLILSRCDYCASLKFKSASFWRWYN
ncbi:unnamed protein product [Trichogramma brassicae]|uniref:Uncharacterized protein n=1 Tax=Trichogramma brassicae TaxID=86971 RepID=A0A6H5IHL4_9HYME|nr:unnamed protein product [Trichogramma brassicae]